MASGVFPLYNKYDALGWYKVTLVSVLLKLRDYPEINRIPDYSYIAIYAIGTDIIQDSSGSLTTEQRLQLAAARSREISAIGCVTFFK